MATSRICAIPGCGKDAKTRGFCITHYQSARRLGQIAIRPSKGRTGICSISGCNRAHLSRGYCQMHYQRAKLGNVALDAPPATTPGAARAFLDAFLAAPPQTDECVEWPFSKRHGYGAIKADTAKERTALVTRVVCEAAHGPPRPDDQACHSCDNPPCINPRHLRWGSPADNAMDAKVRGRRPTGEQTWNSRLTDAVATEILSSPESGNKISARLGVDRAIVSRIRNRKAWSHIKLLRESST